LVDVASAYRDAQNFCSQWAFDHGKTDSNKAIQENCYAEVRSRFGLPSQLACSVRDSVAATYKALWTTTRQAIERLKVATQRKPSAGKKSRLPRLYKGLDSRPAFKALTLEYQYGRDYGFKKDQQVSVMTRQGRMTLPYQGWSQHLELLVDPGTKVGAAKLWYDRPRKQWYLLVSFTATLPDKPVSEYSSVVGIDVGQRYHAVSRVVDLTDQAGKTSMYEGRSHRLLADQFQFIRTKLQAKGTRSALRRLRLLSGRERRFTADRNHILSKQLITAHQNALIAMEELSHIRDRTERGSSRKASRRMKASNRIRSSWSFAALRALVTYKAPLSGSLVVAVDPRYTSQQCPRCGHTGRENRPQGGEIFLCVACGYQGHADVVGATNIGMKAYMARMEGRIGISGCLSATPSAVDGAVDVTHDDAEVGLKVENRKASTRSPKLKPSVVASL